MFWNKYPYTNFHEINLDWILARMMELHKEWDEFTAVNKITNAGAWDITKQYQAWTVVSDNNAGYISMKPVPAGVAITNTEYWGLIADYNILITDLSNRISTLEGQMATLNNTTIPAINNRISLLDSHKCVFIGDSYNTTDTPPGGVPIVPWSTDLVQYLGLSAGDYYNIGNSGSGFVHGTPFIDLLETVSASVTNKTEITDLVLLGGINDISEDPNDVFLAMEAFIARATTLYPNAMITLGFISWSLNLTSRESMLKLIQYWNAMEKHPNVRTITNAFKFYHYYGAMYQPDGHPNATGSSYIARGIANFLKGGSTDVHWYTEQENVTLDAGLNVTQGTMSIQFTQQNENIITHLKCDSYFRSSGFEINTDSEITIGTFTQSLAKFAKQARISGHGYVYNGSYYNISFVFVFENNTIKMRILEVGGGSIGGQTISNITLFKFNIPGFFVTPVEYC